MKNTLRKIIDIVIVLASLAGFLWLAYSYYTDKGIPFYYRNEVEMLCDYYRNEVEMLCYLLCAFCYICTFKMMSRNMKPVWKKWVFAVAPSALFTVQLALYNPLLYFLELNFGTHYQKDRDFIPYKYLLIENLTYKGKWGVPRYLFCFIAMYALCAAVIFLQSKYGNRIKLRIKRFIYLFSDTGADSPLTVLLNLYDKDRIDDDTLTKYFNSMGSTEAEKKELEVCMTRFSAGFLYEIYLKKFGSTISEEEYDYYNNKLTKFKEQKK